MLPTGKASQTGSGLLSDCASMRLLECRAQSRCGRFNKAHRQSPAPAAQSMKRPASRSPPSTKAAATRWPRASTSSLSAELEAIEIESTHTIESTDLAASAIDQRFFDCPYYVMPARRSGQEPLRCIRQKPCAQGSGARAASASKRER